MPLSLKNTFKAKCSNVSVALIHTLSNNTRHIAFANLEFTCNIVCAHDLCH